MTTDTPRTDAVIFRMIPPFSSSGYELVDAALARALERELAIVKHHQSEIAVLLDQLALIDELEVYVQPDWPCGFSFAITGFPGRYESARAAIDAALLSDSAPQGAA